MLDRWEGRKSSEWITRLGLSHAEFHEEIGSTNDRAKERLSEGTPGPELILSDRQTAGRGRRGRTWSSNHAGGLWFSVTDVGGDLAPLLPLLAGAAVARGVEACLSPDWGNARSRGSVSDARGALALKWPNDVYAGGRKLAGVLCEAVGERVVVGIGINVNQASQDLPDADVDPVSLRMLQGSPLARGGVLENVVDAWLELRRSLEGVDRAPDRIPRLPEELLSELNQRSAILGAAVAVDGSGRHSNGELGRIELPRAKGGLIQPDGTLVVHAEAGTVEVIAGTVRLLDAV